MRSARSGRFLQGVQLYSLDEATFGSIVGALRVRAWLRADEDPAAALADLERFLER